MQVCVRAELVAHRPVGAVARPLIRTVGRRDIYLLHLAHLPVCRVLRDRAASQRAELQDIGLW